MPLLQAHPRKWLLCRSMDPGGLGPSRPSRRAVSVTKRDSSSLNPSSPFERPVPFWNECAMLVANNKRVYPVWQRRGERWARTEFEKR